MNKLVYLNRIQASNRLLRACLSNNLVNKTLAAQYSELNKNNSFDISATQRRLVHSTVILRNAETQATEKVVGPTEKYDFMAETKQLLNIVAKSLYSEKEVFIRELISNASDAIEKLKYAELTSQDGQSAQSIPYEIRITANDMNNTLIIQDTGLGMTKAELIQNLGTIAHSGSKVTYN